MRISDWSSDVCSSDLSKEQIEDMASVGLPQLLDYVCAFIIKGLSVIQRTQCGMALVSTSSICQGEQVALRSEEHTSELQSLMRISYAVFCLKKKKHKQHKQRYHTYTNIHTYTITTNN